MDPETGKLLNDVFEGKKEDNKTFDSDRKQPKLPRQKPKDDPYGAKAKGGKRREIQGGEAPILGLGENETGFPREK